MSADERVISGWRVICRDLLEGITNHRGHRGTERLVLTRHFDLLDKLGFNMVDPKKN